MRGRWRRLGLNPGMLLAGPPAPATAMAPPPAPAYAYQPAVSPRGVAAVQDRLRQLGYYHGNVDGVWGAETQQALQAFQQGHGLQPDAQLTPMTVSALGLNPGGFAGGKPGAGCSGFGSGALDVLVEPTHQRSGCWPN